MQLQSFEKGKYLGKCIHTYTQFNADSLIVYLNVVFLLGNWIAQFREVRKLKGRWSNVEIAAVSQQKRVKNYNILKKQTTSSIKKTWDSIRINSLGKLENCSWNVPIHRYPCLISGGRGTRRRAYDYDFSFGGSLSTWIPWHLSCRILTGAYVQHHAHTVT